jgi:creatinine amidohydrolase
MARWTWEEQSATRFAELARAGAVALWPVGAIEQHGPHLPLGTDAIIAEAVARAAAEEAPLDVVLLPTQRVGLSSEHLWARGTISMSPTELLAQVATVTEAVARAGLHRLVLLNGHGGNSALLRVAAREARIAHGLLVFLTHPRTPRDARAGSADDLEIHAGFGETSLMAWLRPELVDLDNLEANEPTWLETYERIGFGGPTAFAWSSRDFGPSGVIGDPRGANPDDGKALFAEAVDDLVATLLEASRFRFS